MTFQEKADAFFSFSRMLEAGMPFSNALRVLIDQKPSSQVAAWLLGLQKELEENHSFSEAIARQVDASEIEKTLIHAGEFSGKLPQMLAEIADYYRLLAESRNRAFKGLLYPVVLLQFAVASPEIPRLFGDEPTILVLAHIVLKLLVMCLLLLGMFKMFVTLRRNGNKLPSLEKIFDWIPFYGKVHNHAARARFAKVVEIGLLAALGMPEIFRLAGRASQSCRIQNAAEIIATCTAQGESLADSLAKTDAFPRWFRESIAVAEVSGTLDTGMKRLALMEYEAFVEAQESASKRLPVFLYSAAACYAVFQILRQYQAHFSLYQEYL